MPTTRQQILKIEEDIATPKFRSLQKFVATVPILLIHRVNRFIVFNPFRLEQNNVSRILVWRKEMDNQAPHRQAPTTMNEMDVKMDEIGTKSRWKRGKAVDLICTSEGNRCDSYDKRGLSREQMMDVDEKERRVPVCS